MPIETIVVPVGKSDLGLDLQIDIIFGGNGGTRIKIKGNGICSLESNTFTQNSLPHLTSELTMHNRKDSFFRRTIRIRI